MKSLLSFTFLISFLALSAQETSRAKFDSLLTRAKIDFVMPDSCAAMDIEFMHKIPHNFVVGPSDSSFQIRYWIRPLDTWFERYDQLSKKEKKKSMHPDALCKSMMVISVLDASRNKSQNYQVSQYPELTKAAYNADWEAVALVESGWPTEGFKYCYILSLHKDGVADVYVYVLANTKEEFFKISALMAKSVRFKE